MCDEALSWTVGDVINHLFLNSFHIAHRDSVWQDVSQNELVNLIGKKVEIERQENNRLLSSLFKQTVGRPHRRPQLGLDTVPSYHIMKEQQALMEISVDLWVIVEAKRGGSLAQIYFK